MSGIYMPQIKDVRCSPESGIYLPHYPIKGVKWQMGKTYEYQEIEEMKKQMEIAKEKPFTRFELPDNIEVVEHSKAHDSLVTHKRHSVHMLCCSDLESARKLRTEIIKSLELLNFYIDQVEETGEIRYVR